MFEDRKQTLDAIIGAILQDCKLSYPEKNNLKNYVRELKKIIPILEKHKNVREYLLNMIDHASGTLKAKKLDVNIFGDYDISYSGEVKGLSKTFINSKIMEKLPTSKMRLKAVKGIPSSWSYSLLVGEIFQFAIKDILKNLIVLGKKIKEVKQLNVKSDIKGKRVDDWILTLSNDSKIPVEVKSSTRKYYFYKAYQQIKNAIAGYNYAIFIGILYSSKQIIIFLVSKEDDYNKFKTTISNKLKGIKSSPKIK
jgi:hypothetical protein